MAAKCWWHLQTECGTANHGVQTGNADQDFENLEVEVDVDVNDFRLTVSVTLNLPSSIPGHICILSSRRTCVRYSRHSYVSCLRSAVESIKRRCISCIQNCLRPRTYAYETLYYM
jgi:hypothetical protein